MALWQVIDVDNKNGNPISPPLDEQWDDGLRFIPSEPGFSTAGIIGYAGVGNYNYMGTPNWEGEAP